jgi:hypothetical protein
VSRFTIGSSGKVPGKENSCDKRRNNNKNNAAVVLHSNLIAQIFNLPEEKAY